KTCLAGRQVWGKKIILQLIIESLKHFINYIGLFSHLTMAFKKIFRNNNKPHKLNVKAVNKMNYEKEVSVDKEKNETEEYLAVETFTFLQRQIIVFEIIADLLLVPYGIYLYDNYEGF